MKILGILDKKIPINKEIPLQYHCGLQRSVSSSKTEKKILWLKIFHKVDS